MALSAAYNGIVNAVDKFVPDQLRPLWNHPAGPKTVFFWAPLFKWSLVLAGLKDLGRPPDQISLNQAGSIAATGLIWSRYSLVIIPKNWALFSVNMFVALANGMLFVRGLNYRKSLKKAKQKKTKTE